MATEQEVKTALKKITDAYWDARKTPITRVPGLEGTADILPVGPSVIALGLLSH